MGPYDRYKLGYSPYKWPEINGGKCGEITPISGLITLLITGRGPSCMINDLNTPFTTTACTSSQINKLFIFTIDQWFGFVGQGCLG